MFIIVPTSIKVKLRRKANKSGKYGIVIQIIHNRKPTEISVNEYVEQKHFDFNKGIVKSNHPRAAKLNKVISDARKDIEDIVFEFKQSDLPFSITDISQAYKESLRPSETLNTSFRDYMKKFIDDNPEELGYSTLKYYGTAYNKWTDAMSVIKLANISEKDIIKFRDSLIKENLEPATVYKNLKVIKKLVRLAKKNNLLVGNPFMNIQFKKSRSQRQYLEWDELMSLQSQEVHNKKELLAKDVFLFSAYTGLRFGDMCKLTKTNIVNNNGTYRLKILIEKTKEPLEFNLNNRAVDTIKRYIIRQEKYIFPMLDRCITESKIEIRKKTEAQNAFLNRALKDVAGRAGIQKNISMHTARHTFAVLSIEKGGDLYVLSKMLGHTSVVTTEIYAKMVDKRKDELTELWNYE